MRPLRLRQGRDRDDPEYCRRYAVQDLDRDQFSHVVGERVENGANRKDSDSGDPADREREPDALFVPLVACEVDREEWSDSRLNVGEKEIQPHGAFGWKAAWPPLLSTSPRATVCRPLWESVRSNGPWKVGMLAHVCSR
jgi:hypothetical protein